MNSHISPKKSFKKEVFELIRFTLIVLAVVIPLRIFIAQPFIVNGESMIPTFENGDYLIVDEVSYRYHEPARGEVIVFRFPSNHKRFLIKRVIGLPGETVTISGNKITISKADGTVIQLDEPYVNGNFSSYGTWKLDSEEYFVMGDNRQRSSDSRSWGVLPQNLIVGKTFVRMFPLDDITYQPGEYESENIEVTLDTQ